MAAAMVFKDATIRSLKQTPKSADSGYSLTTVLTMEGLYSPELEKVLVPDGEDPDESVRVYRSDGSVRRGYSGVGLYAYVQSAVLKFFEMEASRKPGDKPLLVLPSCSIDTFSVSDNRGVPHVSFKVTCETGAGKAAAFLDARKVYFGVVEADELQLSFPGMEEKPEEGEENEENQMALSEDGQKPSKKKSAKKKEKAPKKKATAPKKKKGRERK